MVLSPFLKNKINILLLHASGVLPPNRPALKTFWRSLSTSLPPAFNNSAVTPSSQRAFPSVWIWFLSLELSQVRSGFSRSSFMNPKVLSKASISCPYVACAKISYLLLWGYELHFKVVVYFLLKRFCNSLWLTYYIFDYC